ncbi:MAG: DMT family transporter [Proteobacteria bacterium]|nr:DMT family transporter [Pseudomonadota bacterium]
MNALRAKASENLRGILLMLVAAAIFSLMHACMRYVTRELHPLEAIFLRSVFSVLTLIPFFMRLGLSHLKTTRPGLHLLRIAFNAASQVAFFWGVALTPLVEVAALSFTAPLFATVMAVVVLGEVIRVRRITALLAGMIGTVVILRPGLSAVHPGMVLIVVSSVTWSVALITIKMMARTESALTITTYLSLSMIPISLVPSLFVWRAPSLEELLLVAAVGVLGTLGQLAFTQALRYAETTVLMPLDFTKLVWSYALGFAIFGELPDGWTLVGGLIIFASATYVTIREARLKDREAPATAGPPPDAAVGPAPSEPGEPLAPGPRPPAATP